MNRISFAALALACVCLNLSPALADVAGITPGTVVVPVGSLVDQYGMTAATWAVTALSGVVATAIGAYVPMARSVVTQERVQQAGMALAQWGVKALADSTKDEKVTVSMGPKVIAEAVQRGIDVLPKRALKAAKGPEGLAAVVFRNLPLEAAASKENVLQPALKLLADRGLIAK